jgi:hypothetical protein
MDIPNIFKQRVGAIQLSDLDDNFDIVKVTVNTQATEIATLQTGVANLNTTLANYSAIPIGCIVLWSGTISTIPSGWRLCDGTNNTPDLRDRFVIGARADSSGPATTFVTGADTKSGGSKDAVAVDHTHTATSSASSSSTAQVSSDTDSWSGNIYSTDGSLYGQGSFTNYTATNTINLGSPWTNYEYSGVTISHSHTHAHTVNVTTTTSVTTSLTGTGVSGTNKNLPPYYALAYIMKV